MEVPKGKVLFCVEFPGERNDLFIWADEAEEMNNGSLVLRIILEEEFTQISGHGTLVSLGNLIWDSNTTTVRRKVDVFTVSEGNWTICYPTTEFTLTPFGMREW